MKRYIVVCQNDHVVYDTFNFDNTEEVREFLGINPELKWATILDAETGKTVDIKNVPSILYINGGSNS